MAIEALIHFLHQGLEFVSRPAFGGAVFRAGADADDAFLGVRLPEGFSGRTLGGTAPLGDPPVAVGVMLGRAVLFFGFADDLVEEPVARVAAVTDAAGNPREPNLERGAQGIREQNRDLELASQFFRNGKNRLARLEGNHLVHIADTLPETGELFRSQHGEVGIGAAELEGADGFDGHHRVTEPVWGANNHAERMGTRLVRRKKNPALGVFEQKIRVRGFPAVVNPKPIGGRGADLFFEGLVDVERELVGILGGPRHFLADDDAPFRETLSENRHRQDGGIGPNRQRGRERRGRAKPPEKRSPNSAVAGVLIDQHAEDARLAEQSQRALEALLPVEGEDSETAAVAVHKVIHEFVVERLVDGSETRLGHGVDELRVEFPIANVVDGKKHRTALGDVFPDEVEVFNRGDSVDRFVRERGDFDGADHIGAKGGEVFENQPADLRGGKFAAESDRQIFPCEAAVAGQDEPHQRTAGLTHHEAQREGQAPDKTQNGQRKNIDQSICHDGQDCGN